MADSKHYKGSRVELEEQSHTYASFMRLFWIGALVFVASVFGLVAVLVWHWPVLGAIVAFCSAVVALGAFFRIETLAIFWGTLLTAGHIIVGWLVLVFTSMMHG
ncbi:MAG: hypothetical protein HXY25_09185 [Alphaproteobacteria bacterium]|nr:hypothetical protein [Alphaproteobacteria bacterium]